MSEFDIEDLGSIQKKSADDTIELPEFEKASYIKEIIQEHDLENAIDLFGSDLLVDSITDDQIDIMTFCPNNVASFKKYGTEILNFYDTIPDDSKSQFAFHLIQKLVSPLSSLQLEEILEKLLPKLP